MSFVECLLVHISFFWSYHHFSTLIWFSYLFTSSFKLQTGHMTYPQYFLCFNKFISSMLPRGLPKTPSNSPYVFRLTPVLYLVIPLWYLSRYTCVVTGMNSLPTIWSILLHSTNQKSLPTLLLFWSTQKPFVSPSLVTHSLVDSWCFVGHHCSASVAVTILLSCCLKSAELPHRLIWENSSGKCVSAITTICNSFLS